MSPNQRLNIGLRFRCVESPERQRGHAVDMAVETIGRQTLHRDFKTQEILAFGQSAVEGQNAGD